MRNNKKLENKTYSMTTVEKGQKYNMYRTRHVCYHTDYSITQHVLIRIVL